VSDTGAVITQKTFDCRTQLRCKTRLSGGRPVTPLNQVSEVIKFETVGVKILPLVSQPTLKPLVNVEQAVTVVKTTVASAYAVLGAPIPSVNSIKLDASPST
jgi:hypothetical protein